MSDSRLPVVSVIIPVLNRAALLENCLNALEGQAWPVECYEVIVVDNGSNEDIKAVTKKFKHVILANEPLPGSYAARNKGVSIAKGEVLAFTDQDCIPEPDWIKEGVAAFLGTPGCGLVAGKIKIFFRERENPTPVELCDSLTVFDQKEYIEKQHGCTTANVFTAKSVMKKAGLFDAGLKSAGDFEWAGRVYRLGLAQVYAEKACVAHPARSTLSELYEKQRRVAGGLHDLAKKQGKYSCVFFAFKLAGRIIWHLKEFGFLYSKARNYSFRKRVEVLLILLLVKSIRIRERFLLLLA